MADSDGDKTNMLNIRSWQIILKDSPIILFFYVFPDFQPIILPLFSNSTMHPQQKLIAMTCAFKCNPKTTVFLCIHAACKALQSSSCPFKVGILGYGNLQTMSMDKWAT